MKNTDWKDESKSQCLEYQLRFESFTTPKISVVDIILANQNPGSNPNILCSFFSLTLFHSVSFESIFFKLS